MQYKFDMKPIIFTSPANEKLKYIVGVKGGWLDYTPELHAEVMKQWEDENKNNTMNIPVAAAPKEFIVKSNSDPDKTYIVKQLADGSMTCDCPGFGFRRKCKHIESIKEKKE
jgi:hypothetical protein